MHKKEGDARRESKILGQNRKIKIKKEDLR